MRGFLTAHYKEPKADSTFKGFEVSLTNEKNEKTKILFNTGDPVYDYYAYKRWMMNTDLHMITHSSSVDHFFMDSNKYFERHIVFEQWPPEKETDGDLMYWKDAENLGHNIDKLVTVMALKEWKKFSEVKKYIKDKEEFENIVVNEDFTITLKTKTSK